MSVLANPRAYIRVRVTAVAATVALATITVGSVLFVLTLHNSLQQDLISTSREEISTITAQLSDGVSPQQAVVTGRTDVVVQLVDANGRVLASDHAATMGAPLLPRPGRRTEMAVPGQRDRFTVVARRIRADDQVRLVVVGRSTEQSERARTTTSLLLTAAVPAVVALLAATVWVSIGRALRPVEAMRREAEAITSANLDRRLALPPGDDEIPRLALTLNEMLDGIDQSHRLQRQFVSDASHELRSPLSAIRQSAEVARAYPDRASLDVLAKDVLLESRRMESLVDALLLLARLDDSAAPVESRDVDLDDLVLADVDRLAPAGCPVEVDVSHVSAGQVHGSPILLAQVVHNLLGNAVRHARARVAVSLREWDGRVELTVDDDGIGVPSDQRERVFERFVRLDEARARDAGGAGLGLAIVRKIVELSDGTVELGSSPLGGARFSVDLPAAH